MLDSVRRATAPAVVAVAVAAALGLIAGPATASTVTSNGSIVNYKESLSGGVLPAFNNVTARSAGAGKVEIEDTGQYCFFGGCSPEVITSPDNSCTILNGGKKAQCPVNQQVAGLIIAVGQYQDQVTIEGSPLGSAFSFAQIYGGGGGDWIKGGSTNLEGIYGEGGDDTIDGSAGVDLMDGGSENDTVSYASHSAATNVSINSPVGQAGNDGNAADTAPNVNSRDDVAGFENVVGGSGADTITGDGNANTIEGGDGEDTLDGGAGADKLYGSTAANTVGLSEHDNLHGGEGDDITLIGGGGSDYIAGGLGNDTVGGLADEPGVDWIVGSDNNVTEPATSGLPNNRNDTLNNGADGDMLVGGTGDDIYKQDSPAPYAKDVYADGVYLPIFGFVIPDGGKDTFNTADLVFGGGIAENVNCGANDTGDVITGRDTIDVFTNC